MSSREEEETLSIEIPKNAIEQEIDLQDLVEMFVDRQLQKRQEMQHARSAGRSHRDTRRLAGHQTVELRAR